MSASYCEIDSIEWKQLKTSKPAIYGNNVWTNELYTLEKVFEDGDVADESFFSMKEVYAMADYENVGFLGRRQFKDLLDLLNIAVDDDMLVQMFNDMDEDANGQIEFDEFASAMVSNLGLDALQALSATTPGAMGTRAWTRGQIIWAANTGLILITVGMGLAGLVFFQFILVPVMLSYFFVWLVAPLMDLFEHRPLECGSTSCCNPMEPDPDNAGEKRYKSETRRNMEGKPYASCYDIFTLGRVPHGLSVLGCIVVVFGSFFLVLLMLNGEIAKIRADKEFMDALTETVDNVYASLNESGILILRKNRPEGYTQDELAGIGNTINALVGMVGLIFLLTVYIMAEKVEVNLFSESASPILQEVEAQVKYYIVLKTAISFLTGVLVSILLLIFQVKLAVMFGLLSFLLNYIPNVGSMVAMMLPIPIVLVDKNMATWQQVGAFVGPGMVQGYVGNVLEPVVFGKSLNMTPLAILAALAIWGSVWGLIGAVLSVPLLAVQKICLMHANHPLAKTFLMCIREDATIDEMEQTGGHHEEEDTEATAGQPDCGPSG